MPSDIRLLEFLLSERLSPKWVVIIIRIERRIRETLDMAFKKKKKKR
jgi:hypothetical protein